MATNSKGDAEGRRAEDRPLPDKDVESRFKRAVRNLLAAPKKLPAKPERPGRRPVVTGNKKQDR